KEGRTAVAADNYVIECARKFNARFSSHNWNLQEEGHISQYSCLTPYLTPYSHISVCHLPEQWIGYPSESSN
ncbi:MAG: hypothetical protein ACE1ZW_06730, partial [Nitrospirales bacterium]